MTDERAAASGSVGAELEPQAPEPGPASVAPQAPAPGPDLPEPSVRLDPSLQPSPGPGPAPAPEPSPAELPPHLQPPAARNLIGRGFDLVLRSTLDLRPPSLTIATQFVGLFGPLVIIVAIALVDDPVVLDVLFGEATYDPRSSANVVITLLTLAGLIAAIGGIALVVEGEAIAIAILGARLIGRPLSFEAALTRARQSFWNLVTAGLVIGIPLYVVSIGLGLVLGAAERPEEWKTLVATLLVGLIGVPFSYVAAGIVLGDVGPIEAVRRSIRLYRARKRVALALAAFASVFSVLAQFALFAGGDVLLRLGELFGLGFEGSPASTLATYAVMLVAVLATGSLLFTVNAIIAAPQVVAFVGLTHASPGLDRAAEAVARRVAVAPAPLPADLAPASHWAHGDDARERTGAPRWLTIPMALLILSAIASAIGGCVAIGQA